MEKITFIVGRQGDIRIEDPCISKKHIEIQLRDLGIYLRDLDSTNGTFLIKNNRAIQFHEGYVQFKQEIMLGRRIFLMSTLLEKADELGLLTRPRMIA